MPHSFGLVLHRSKELRKLLLYKCTTWTLTKRIEKKLDSNCTRMLLAILNKSWKQHPTKKQLYSHLPPILKTIQIRWIRHVGHCWKSKDKLISNVLLWTSSHGCASVGQPARIYLQQLCTDTGCGLEDLPEARDDRDRLWERVREICVSSTTWWWYIYIYPRTHIYTNPNRDMHSNTHIDIPGDW